MKPEEPQLFNIQQADIPQGLVVGRITGHFGVRGWLKVVSYTRPPMQILEFPEWHLYPQQGLAEPRSGLVTVPRVLQQGRLQGKGIIAKLAGVDSREDAEPLLGLGISVPESALVELPDGEFYWSQLEGLMVRNLQGELLGRIDHLLETGANDVLVVIAEADAGQERVERLLPWTDQVVKNVDLSEGTMQVDWEMDF